jgi:hypothetical protein
MNYITEESGMTCRLTGRAFRGPAVAAARLKVWLPPLDRGYFSAKLCVGSIKLPCSNAETLLKVPLQCLLVLAYLDACKKSSLNAAMKTSMGIKNPRLISHELRACLVSMHGFTHIIGRLPPQWRV